MSTAVAKKYVPTDDEIREKLKLIPRKNFRPYAQGFVANLLGPKKGQALTPPMRQFAKDLIHENGLTFP